MVNLVVHGELRHIKQLGNFTTTAVTGYSSRIGLTWQFGSGTCCPPLVSDSWCSGWSNPRLDAATEQLTTMVYGILNATTGQFRYVSAGHPGPVHLPAGGQAVILESQGFPLGLTDNAYEERTVCLGPGDRLYLYCVPEAMDPEDKQFGNARLVAAISEARPQPLQESIVTLLGQVARWRGSERPRDDISILGVEVWPIGTE